MATTPDLDARAPWRGLLRFALAVLIAVGVLIHAMVQMVIPPVLVFVILFGVALFLLAREGRARTVGVVLGGVFGLLFLLGNLPFVIADLAHPESFLAFVASGAGVVGALLAPVAMLGALVGWPAPAARPLKVAGATAIALVAVVGIVAMVRVEDDEAQRGDAVLVAEDVDFQPEGSPLERPQDAAIEVTAGGAVFVENKDLFRHTFAIDELDLEVELPAGVGRRVEIDAPAGEYVFYCSVEGHEEDMRGTLTVA
jgi:plastocyanin